MDWSFADFVIELTVGIGSLPFFYLTWASGYVGHLVRMAKRNRWGLELLKKRTPDDWEEEFAR